MTRTIVAILALSPAVLFAQTSSPAQPSSTPVLQTSLLAANALSAGISTENAPDSSTPKRISTGVVGPKLIRSVNLPADVNAKISAAPQHVVLELTIDASGTPQDLKVVASTDDNINPKILSTISQYRYQPGTLNGQPTAVPLRLEINVPRGTAY